MASTFERSWQEAYTRDVLIIKEAERIAGDAPELLADPVMLFRVAGAQVEATRVFEEAIALVQSSRHNRVRAMMRLLSSS